VDERNWAGSHVYEAHALHRPASLDELREVVARAARVRVLGSRHSFTDIADTDELVSLDRLPAAVELDRGAGTVHCGAGLRLGDLAAALDDAGLALHNLPSLPHVNVAGAVATATHGSGDALGNLATAVAGIELVTSDGDVVTASRGEEDFDGLVVGLGALGAVTRLELDVEPAYAMRQRVYEGLAWEALLEHLDTILACGQSVSVFTSWGEDVEQVWVKSRVTDEDEVVRDELFGARPASLERHPIIGLDPVNCSAQLGVPGPWWDRLPHFRMGFTPSSGEELQSEFHFPRAHARAAVEAVRALGGAIRPVLQVSELRSVAADRLWMSPQQGRDTLSLHFTWLREPAAVDRALALVEPALAPFGARPHWGKLFRAGAEELAPRYERHADFVALAERLDPRGAFANAWYRRCVSGAALGSAPA
jgi:alditol oxidase